MEDTILDAQALHKHKLMTALADAVRFAVEQSEAVVVQSRRDAEASRRRLTAEVERGS